MARDASRLITALPLTRRGDGPGFCRQFCALYDRVIGRNRIPAHVRLKDGPYLCICHCKGFAAQNPTKIYRPRRRGRQIAKYLAKEAVQ